MTDPVSTTPIEQPDGGFIPVKVVKDPAELVAGNQLVHMASLWVGTISRRKDDDSGWWMLGGGGLVDDVIASGSWRLIPAEPQTWRVQR